MTSRRNSRVVVCVDDEPAVLSALRRSLRNEPYRLLTTERPVEAIEWVRTREVHLLISDQRMPDMLGSELLAEVRRSSPSTTRMLLTGYPGDSLECRESDPGAYRLVQKPWDDDDLRRCIRLLLFERRPEAGQEAP